MPKILKFDILTASAVAASNSCYQTLGPVCVVFLFIKVGRINVLIPAFAVTNGMLPEVMCFFNVMICNLSRMWSWSDYCITFCLFYIKTTKMSQICM